MQHYFELVSFIKKLDNVLLAYSGGVDSAFLLKACRDALPSAQVCAVTFVSSAFDPDDTHNAAELARLLQTTHYLIDMDHLTLAINNPENRCYVCKAHMFSKLNDFASNIQFANILDGSNFDDLDSHRPGKKAAVEYNVISPLELLKFTKKEIRIISQKLNLPTYNKPSSPCLLTRFEHNTAVNIEMLTKIREVEKQIQNLGINNLRARYKSNKSLKLESDCCGIQLIINFKDEISELCANYGFIEVSLDLKAKPKS